MAVRVYGTAVVGRIIRFSFYHYYRLFVFDAAQTRSEVTRPRGKPSLRTPRIPSSALPGRTLSAAGDWSLRYSRPVARLVRSFVLFFILVFSETNRRCHLHALGRRVWTSIKYYVPVVYINLISWLRREIPSEKFVFILPNPSWSAVGVRQNEPRIVDEWRRDIHQGLEH